MEQECGSGSALKKQNPSPSGMLISGFSLMTRRVILVALTLDIPERRKHYVDDFDLLGYVVDENFVSFESQIKPEKKLANVYTHICIRVCTYDKNRFY